jgi:hypothetical protein
MRTFHIEVSQLVEVRLDETKFTDAFMAEFRAGFFPIEDLEGHAEHIAQLQARGVIEIDTFSSEFIEGYGLANEMGIAAKVIGTEVTQVTA